MFTFIPHTRKGCEYKACETDNMHLRNILLFIELPLHITHAVHIFLLESSQTNHLFHYKILPCMFIMLFYVLHCY